MLNANENAAKYIILNLINIFSPGILIMKGKHQFICNKPNHDWTRFLYCCKYRTTPGIECKAKVKVIRTQSQDGTEVDKVLQFDLEHNHPANEALVISEKLKEDMAAIVRKSPEKPVSLAVKKIKTEAEEKYNETEEDALLWKAIVDELGPDSAMEKRLLRVREKVIGKTPKSRETFYPKEFLDNVFKLHKVEVMDSNEDLDDDWEEQVSKKNPNSQRRWNRRTEQMKQYEEDIDDVDEGIVEDECENCKDKVPHECLKDNENQEGHEEVLRRAREESRSEKEVPEGPKKKKPKRVLAFSNNSLLKLLSQHKKSSVDGTFKSAPVLWKQQFIWMVKINGM